MNTTQYTHDGHTTHFSWDGADRNTAVRTLGPDPADVGYTRDATDRIIRRAATVGDAVSEVHYGHTGDGDTAEFALDDTKKILTRSISLPGGVLHTWKPTAADRTYDHPTVRGDLTLTTGNTGLQVGDLRSYGPYGETLTDMPDNQPGNMDYGWLGQHQRPHEHAGALSIVQMGARPYSPLLGRFLSIDGGSANDYDYVAADPLNSTDLDGNARWRKKCSRSLWGGLKCRYVQSGKYHKTVRHYNSRGGYSVYRYKRSRIGFGYSRWSLDSANGCKGKGKRKVCWNSGSKYTRRPKPNWRSAGLGCGAGALGGTLGGWAGGPLSALFGMAGGCVGGGLAGLLAG